MIGYELLRTGAGVVSHYNGGRWWAPVVFDHALQARPMGESAPRKRRLQQIVFDRRDHLTWPST
jgi:hypothetical protein